jgi:hypothetical protein
MDKSTPHKFLSLSSDPTKILGMVLRIFAILYTFMTLLFFQDIYADQSASLGYLYIFPMFWFFAGVVLVLLILRKKVKINSNGDRITLMFATPVPTLIFFAIGSFISESPSSTYEFNRNGHRHRVVTYDYRSGKKKRVEFYRSGGRVTNESPFPPSHKWLKDSVWIYYDRNGQIDKTEDFRISP